MCRCGYSQRFGRISAYLCPPRLVFYCFSLLIFLFSTVLFYCYAVYLLLSGIFGQILCKSLSPSVAWPIASFIFNNNNNNNNNNNKYMCFLFSQTDKETYNKRDLVISKTIYNTWGNLLKKVTISTVGVALKFNVYRKFSPGNNFR